MMEVGVTREIGTQERPKQRYQLLREAKENKMQFTPNLVYNRHKASDTKISKPRLRIEKKNGIYVFNMTPYKDPPSLLENEKLNKNPETDSICTSNGKPNSINSNNELNNNSQHKLKKHCHSQYNPRDFMEKPKKNEKKMGQGDVKRDIKRIQKMIKNEENATKLTKRIWR